MDGRAVLKYYNSIVQSLRKGAVMKTDVQIATRSGL